MQTKKKALKMDSLSQFIRCQKSISLQLDAIIKLINAAVSVKIECIKIVFDKHQHHNLLLVH